MDAEHVMHEVVHLIAEGRLDRLDAQILVVQSNHPTAGSMMIGQVLGVPRSTVKRRIKKIRLVMNSR